MRRAAAAMSLAATLLAGCASVPHVAPQVAQATPAALGLSTETATVDAAWWRAFGDPQLDRLIADGLAGNPSLESALARVRIARATLGTEEARREPQVTANGSVLYQRLGTNLLPKPYGGSGKFLPSLQANLDWDLDVFGRQRAAIARAAADARAAELDAASARLTLTTSIAQAYVGLARAERLIVVADSFVAARREALDFVRSRIRNQLASQFDARQAETLLAEAEQARVRAAAERDMLVHALAALTGHGAEAYATIAAPALALDRVPTVPALLPADLLGRRPDLLAGQARIDAAAAGRAVARADFLPNVDLQALAGLISLGLGSFLGAGSITYGATPAIHLPIFDGGRLRANYAGATAGLDRAVADYDDAVLGAVRDAADAITNVRAADADVAAADRIVAGLRATVRLDAVRTRTGLGSKLDAIDSGFRLLEAEQSLVGSQAAALTRRIELVAALGGGFDPSSIPATDKRS